jgi:hypothetical protein
VMQVIDTSHVCTAKQCRCCSWSMPRQNKNMNHNRRHCQLLLLSKVLVC